MRNLSYLKEQHKKIIELSLEGKTASAIALELDLQPQSVDRILAAPITQGELARRRREITDKVDEAREIAHLNARETLDGASVEAARTQIRLLLSENERVRQTAAMDILDRTGVPKISRNDSIGVNTNIQLDESVLRRLISATQECFGKTPDFTFIGPKSTP